MNKTPKIIIACVPVDPEDRDAFQRAIARLDAALDRLPAQRRACLQDGDDLTFFDHDSLRVGLSWLDLPERSFLILALGAPPDILPFNPGETTNDVFARALLRMIAPQVEADLVLWQVAQGALIADVLDGVADRLEKEEPRLPAAVHVLRPAQMGGPSLAPDMRALDLPHAGPEPRLHLNEEDVLADLRAVLDEAEPSMQMKLSAYALSTAFIFVTPAVGFAMLTYAILRHGEALMSS